MKLLSLFSGIGAFEKALERKGIDFELVNYCEFDKYASKSYSLIHNVSETMNLGDITKVNIEDLEPYSADLITYGFPCQDISNAGKQRGFEHDGQLTRSGLFFYASEIIGRVKPKVAICENVKALVGKKFTKEFETVLSTLEDMGYTNYWQVLNAKDYGIPQNRERVFIVSIRNDIDKKYKFPAPIKLELRLKDIIEKEVDEKYYLSQHAIIGRSKTNFNQYKLENKLVNNMDIHPTILARYDGAPTLIKEEPIIVYEATKKGYAEAHDGDSINFEQPNSKTRRGRVGKGVAQTLNTSPQQAVVEPSLRIRKLTPKECFRLMGFDDEDFYKAESVNSNTQLYKQAGNSIVVNVLEAIFENLKDILCD